MMVRRKNMKRLGMKTHTSDKVILLDASTIAESFSCICHMGTTIMIATLCAYRMLTVGLDLMVAPHTFNITKAMATQLNYDINA